MEYQQVKAEDKILWITCYTSIYCIFCPRPLCTAKPVGCSWMEDKTWSDEQILYLIPCMRHLITITTIHQNEWGRYQDCLANPSDYWIGYKISESTRSMHKIGAKIYGPNKNCWKISPLYPWIQVKWYLSGECLCAMFWHKYRDSVILFDSFSWKHLIFSSSRRKMQNRYIWYVAPTTKLGRMSISRYLQGVRGSEASGQISVRTNRIKKL